MVKIRGTIGKISKYYKEARRARREKKEVIERGKLGPNREEVRTADAVIKENINSELGRKYSEKFENGDYWGAANALAIIYEPYTELLSNNALDAIGEINSHVRTQIRGILYDRGRVALFKVVKDRARSEMSDKEKRSFKEKDDEVNLKLESLLGGWRRASRLFEHFNEQNLIHQKFISEINST